LKGKGRKNQLARGRGEIKEEQAPSVVPCIQPLKILTRFNKTKTNNEWRMGRMDLI